MLREYLAVYLLWRKVGYILISKEVVKKVMSYVPDKELSKAGESIATRIREAATILQSKSKASLDSYLELIESFASINGFDVERSKNIGDSGVDVLIIQFRLNENYSKFLGSAFRLLIEEFADVTNFETTNNLVFIEYKKRIIKETVEVE
jgi:predicted house-cleaning noncanonical NTP pyrophosphatase (MazG superfamily)